MAEHEPGAPPSPPALVRPTIEGIPSPVGLSDRDAQFQWANKIPYRTLVHLAMHAYALLTDPADCLRALNLWPQLRCPKCGTTDRLVLVELQRGMYLNALPDPRELLRCCNVTTVGDRDIHCGWSGPASAALVVGGAQGEAQGQGGQG